MIEVAIVEDNEKWFKTLEEYLKRYGNEYGTQFGIKWFKDPVTFLEKYTKNCRFVFMDINLPGMDGMTAVKKLRLVDERICVIFVTNLAQYAVNGYEVNAFDFIVKPVSYYDFRMKFKRAMDFYAMKAPKGIWLNFRDGKRMITAEKLRYVEVMKHELVFCLSSGEKVSCSGTLKKVQEDLAGLPFVLCNRCYLVNLAFVREVRGESVFIGNDVLQISLAKKKDFLKSLNDYLSNGGD